MACAKDYMSQTCSNDSLFRNCQLLLCDLGVDVLNTNFPSILKKSEFFSQVQYCLLREPRELRCNTFLYSKPVARAHRLAALDFKPPCFTEIQKHKKTKKLAFFWA